MGYKTYAKLGNKTVEEAQEDLRRFNDPDSLSYKDNWVAKALCDKYGMDVIKLQKVVKELVNQELAPQLPIFTLSKTGWFDQLAGLSEAGLVIGKDFDIKT